MSHQNSLTHRFPRFPPRNLCSSVMLAVFFLLGSYLCRIGRIENPSCSACGHSSQNTSHLFLHCPATDCLCHSLFGNSLSLYDLWSRPFGSCPGSGAPWSSAMPLSLGKGWVTNNTSNLSSIHLVIFLFKIEFL